MNVTSEEAQNKMDISQGVVKGILDAQDKLLDNFITIQNKNTTTSMHLHRNLDLNKPEDQVIIKWYAYCVIEELVEMMMAKSNVLHRKEEYADALAFASELIISLGFQDKFDDKVFENSYYREFNGENVMENVYYLCSACNCLKCKDWKSERVLTDIHQFTSRIVKFYEHLLNFGLLIFKDDIELFDFYSRKNYVNKFRQRSNY